MSSGTFRYTSQRDEGRFMCGVCMEDLHNREPVLLDCEEHFYCASCVDSLASTAHGGDYACPACRKVCDPQNTSRVKFLDRDIKAAEVVCEKKVVINGNVYAQCEWKGPRAAWQSHWEMECVCNYVHCGECKEEMLRAELARHKKNVCSMRRVSCEYCASEMPYCELFRHVETECLMKTVS